MQRGRVEFGWTEWLGLRRLNILPKVKIFVWRACLNILPNAVELVRRHISSNPYCMHCNGALETMAHVLMECRGCEEIWSNPPFKVPSWDIHDAKGMRESLPYNEFLVGLVIWWKMWDIRNKEVHGAPEDIPSDVVEWSRAYLEIYQASQVKPPPSESVALP